MHTTQTKRLHAKLHNEWEHALAEKATHVDDMYSGGLWKIIHLLKDGKTTASKSIKNQGFTNNDGTLTVDIAALHVWEDYFRALGSPEDTNTYYFNMEKQHRHVEVLIISRNKAAVRTVFCRKFLQVPQLMIYILGISVVCTQL